MPLEHDVQRIGIGNGSQGCGQPTYPTGGPERTAPGLRLRSTDATASAILPLVWAGGIRIRDRPPAALLPPILSTARL